ncbi:MAG: ABC transporter permease [Micromonosporaceae bacterium]|jgi:ABC-type nitrate/sulfonate/bicarbonate transport system permease component
MTVRRLLGRAVTALGLPAALVAGWWYASADSRNFLFPPLSRILVALRDTWVGPRLVEDVVPSLLRFAGGYTGALVLGIGLGVLIGSYRWLRALVEPVLEFLRAIPPPVLIPIIILIGFGLGHTMKVTVIVTGCIWPVLLNTVEGVRSVDEVLRDTCRAYRLGRLPTLRHLLLRGASPQIMTGARQALPIGIILTVISEMWAANEGIGFTVVQFQRSFRYPEMWSGVIVLGLIGVGLSLLFRLADRRVLAWYHGIRAVQREG